MEKCSQLLEECGKESKWNRVRLLDKSELKLRVVKDKRVKRIRPRYVLNMVSV